MTERASLAGGRTDDKTLGGGDLTFRHRLSTRIWHWVNVFAVFIMLMSGLMIFNAHPRLYWGQYGADQDPAWFEIGSTEQDGYLRLGDLRMTTTGVLGRWTGEAGNLGPRQWHACSGIIFP